MDSVGPWKFQQYAPGGVKKTFGGQIALRLSRKRPKQVPGRNYPYETMLHGIVEHTIYHSGQIAMILSMLRSRSLPENP
jgi:hypothetical protein